MFNAIHSNHNNITLLVVDESDLQLDQLHIHVWKSISKFLSLADKKTLRLVNRKLYNLIDETDGLFKQPFLGKKPIHAKELRKASAIKAELP